MALAREEYGAVRAALPGLEGELRSRLIPRDPEDGKDAIVEIRAGAGGSEAALFAGDLYRLYDRFAERQGWKVALMNTSEGAAGGFQGGHLQCFGA